MYLLLLTNGNGGVGSGTLLLLDGVVGKAPKEKEKKGRGGGPRARVGKSATGTPAAKLALASAGHGKDKLSCCVRCHTVTVTPPGSHEMAEKIQVMLQPGSKWCQKLNAQQSLRSTGQ